MKNKRYNLKYAILNFCLHLAQIISYLRLNKALDGSFAKWPELTRMVATTFIVCVPVLFYAS